MNFTNLSQDVQDLAILNYEQSSKILVLFCIFALSLIYLLFWKKYVEKETVFFSNIYLRFILTISSYVVLFASPMALVLLSPYYSLWDLMTNITIMLYGVILAIYLFILGIDILYFGVGIFLNKMVKVNFDNKRISKAYKILFPRGENGKRKNF